MKKKEPKEIDSTHFDNCNKEVKDCFECKYYVDKMSRRTKKIPLFILQRNMSTTMQNYHGWDEWFAR